MSDARIWLRCNYQLFLFAHVLSFLFYFFHKLIYAGAVPLSEVDLDTKLTEFRAQCSLYMENSFATIAGVNANAAIIHYR